MLLKLPEVILIEIGQYIDLKLLVRITTQIKSLKVLLIKKRCTTVNLTYQTHARKLKWLPYIKVLELQCYSTLDIYSLRIFDQVETLSIIDAEMNNWTYFNCRCTDHQPFSKLKYLSTDNNHTSKIISLATNLLHLCINKGWLPADYKAPKTLLTLEYNKGAKNISQSFPDIKRIVYHGEHQQFLFQQIKDLSNLEALTLKYPDDLEKLHPEKLRFLVLEGPIEHKFDLTWNLENLEYLSLYSERDYRNYQDIWATAKKLQFVHFKVLHVTRINFYLKLFRTLGLTAFSAGNLLNSTDNVFLDLTSNIIKLEALSNYKFLENRWLSENGYYIKENCTEII